MCGGEFSKIRKFSFHLSISSIIVLLFKSFVFLQKQSYLFSIKFGLGLMCKKLLDNRNLCVGRGGTCDCPLFTSNSSTVYRPIIFRKTIKKEVSISDLLIFYILSCVFNWKQYISYPITSFNSIIKVHCYTKWFVYNFWTKKIFQRRKNNKR